ncbi:hypothetical protein R1flu_020741 [Riccia fluitans]|uniref:non-specific serine/threonine protein kinase n=1 Tax=Riccia fluitans TaxID=41844 RepID=A0ABD1ZMD6_9MARC
MMKLVKFGRLVPESEAQHSRINVFPRLMERRPLRPYLGKQKGFSLPTSNWWTVCLTLGVLSSLVVTVVSQAASDFISIDCGGPGFKNNTTNIEWLPDQQYLEPANFKLLKEKGVIVPATAALDAETSKTLANAELVKTATVFLPGVDGISPSKYCYVVRVENSTNYLVRAMFPNRNLTANDPKLGIDLDGYSTRFYFTVDSTFISTIELDPVAPKTVELVVTPLDENMYICLVPLEDRSSMPAISTIELRPLPTALYLSGRELTTSGSSQDPANQGSVPRGNTGLRTSYLMTVSRLNFGGDTSMPPLRYPIDPHDRLWYPAGPNDTTQPDTLKRTSGTYSNSTTVSGLENWDFPVKVIETAWEGLNPSVNITFKFNVTAARALRPIPTFYFSIALFDVNGPGRGENIYLDDEGSQSLWGKNAELLNDNAWVWYNYKHTFGDSPVFTFFPNASQPAMINIAEVMGEFEAETQRTLVVDGTAIKNFTNNLDRRADIFVDTQGDPCLPVPWNWIICSIESPPRITQINLTSIGATGSIPREFGNLDRLTVLDLSNNSFQGALPQSLAHVRTLRELNLANNNLTGVLPVFKENTSLLNLEILSLRNNSLSGDLTPLFSAMGQKASISKIDLSNNSFNGTLPEALGQLKKLQELDLSWNNFTVNNNFTVDVIGKLINSSTQLRTLSLQNNQFSGCVPPEIWKQGSLLETVDLSDNQFETLDLTMWCNSLGNRSLNTVKQKVNLTNNAIKDVTFPCKDHVNTLTKPKYMDSWFQDSDGFILLGDNPYCSDIGKNYPNRALRYICRHNQYENFWVVDRANKNVIIVASVVSAVVVLLMACILCLVLGRMWKRMKELRHIQEALAKEDVRPPFFKYEELKSAAGDFSEKNKLGQGAFGAVYKAILQDQSVVAVKVLEPTDQNITDFLKEMVLITGIKHKHLIQLKGCCVRDRKRLLVYEYAENKNLADALWGPERTYGLNWEQRFKIILGVAKGLSYLHEELQPKIIHRDIKAPNILLDKNWEAKIADFGLALPVQEQAGGSSSTQIATRIGGTLGYFSPEYATSGKVTEKLDVFSFGILVLEILAGRKCIDLTLTYAPEQVYLKDWAFHKYTEGKVLDVVERGVLATGSAEEILSLKEQERMYEGLFDGSLMGKGTDDPERGLLQSTILTRASSQNPESIIQMSVTKPR